MPVHDVCPVRDRKPESGRKDPGYVYGGTSSRRFLLEILLSWGNLRDGFISKAETVSGVE